MTTTTAPDWAEDFAPYPPPPPADWEPAPAIGPVRFFARLTLLCVWAFALAVALSFGITVADRSTQNWLDGYGFTPFTQSQPVPFVVEEVDPASLNPGIERIAP